MHAVVRGSAMVRFVQYVLALLLLVGVAYPGRPV
jgi:hypothetical protein